MVGQAVGSQRPGPVGGGDDADAAVRGQQDLLTEDRQPQRPLRRHLADRDDRLDDDHRHERDHEALDVVDLVEDVDTERRHQRRGRAPSLAVSTGSIETATPSQETASSPATGNATNNGPTRIRRGDAARLTTQNPSVGKRRDEAPRGRRVSPSRRRRTRRPARHGTGSAPRIAARPIHAARRAATPTRERTSVAVIDSSTFTARTVAAAVVASTICSSDGTAPTPMVGWWSFGSRHSRGEPGPGSQL